MFDTYITVRGNVLNTPEKKTTTRTNAVVTTFRIASHPRRFDRTTSQWVDTDGLRIKVNCWRRLAENVCGSIHSGDPVVVYGRISTREWKNEQGETRISYEMDADAVGHDLTRGTASFTRMRAEPMTVVEDEDSDNRVNGEPTEAFSGGYGVDDRIDDAYEDFAADGRYAPAPGGDDDALAILTEAGLDPARPADEGTADGGADNPDEEAMVGATADMGGSGGRRRRGRQPVPA